MVFIQGNDLEEPIEEQRPSHAPEDRDPDPVRRRIERRVRLERLAVDADLERLELDRHAAERRHVPMPQRLDRESGRRVARPTALALHRGKILSAVFVISVSKVQLESTLCRDYSTWLISSFVGALD